MLPNRVPSQDIILQPESELRFEVEGNSIVAVELKQGLAEIFGREIVLGLKYEFTRGSKIAVFTWHGCKIRLYGRPEYNYISKETSMIQYLNIHCGLEQKRNTAGKKKSRGPVTMIVGAHDVGKSTLAQILLNYAVRTWNRKPIFVDLDIEGNQLSIPGSISALSVESPLSHNSSYSEAALVFHFGHTKINANPGLFTMLVNQMADIVQQKIENQVSSKESGIIINTVSYRRKEGIDHLVEIATVFNVTLILVVDNESLHHFLEKDKRISEATLVAIQKNGGVVQRSEQLRFESCDARIREYFYGRTGERFPFSIHLPFDDVKLWRLGAERPTLCRARAVTSKDKQSQLTPVEISASLLHHLVAMRYMKSGRKRAGSRKGADAEGDDAFPASVAGFLCVTDVDVQRSVLTVLSLHPRPLPECVMLLSTVQFYDQ